METISCEMLHGRLIVITDGTAKEEADADVQQDDMQHNTYTNINRLMYRVWLMPWNRLMPVNSLMPESICRR